MKSTLQIFFTSIGFATLLSTSAFAATSGATGDGVNDFGSCKSDAQKFGCYDEASKNASSSSWKLAFVSCLNSHSSELSSACSSSLSRRADANAAMVAACRADSSKYCKGVVPVPGKEPLVDCLKANQSSLSSACAKALADHEGMKSTSK